MSDLGEGPTSLSRGLMHFALSQATDDIPREVLHAACSRAVDTIGVALASTRSRDGDAARSLVLAEAAPGGASVWASGGCRRPAAPAAFANGMLAHGIDYDDTHTAATLHPGVVVVPAAFAVGEETGASGPDVLAAIAVGYEVATRLGRLAPGSFQRKGFHATSVLGIFGATAAVCRLLGVDEDEAVRAAGIAGSFSSGLMAYLSDGTDTKPIHAGWAAQGAIRAVQLTMHGASGPATVIEGLAGVFPSFVGLQIDPADALVDIGRDWSGLAVATKPYPACHCVHASVDCWKTIRDREGLTADDIPRIRRLTTLVPSWYLHLVGDPIEAKRQPRSVYEARFSLPYAVARVVVDGDLSLASFDGEKIGDPAVLDVAKRVDYEVLEYPEFPSAFPGGLRVEMEDGRIFEEHLPHNVGSAANPMTDEQLHAKFLDAAAQSAIPHPGDALLAALRGFEASADPWESFRAAMTCFDVEDQVRTGR